MSVGHPVFLRRCLSAWLATLLVLFSTVAGVSAQEVAAPKVAEDADAKAKAKPATENSYIRIVKSEKGKPLAMETSVLRFEGRPGGRAEGRSVDLVGVVHIGQQDYYKQIDSLLAGYDAVLYELVAPDGTRIKPEDLQERRSILTSMQSGMKDMLELDFQLEHIDYLAKNFVHADMSPEEFAEDMESRGDGVMKMVMRMMGAGIAAQSTGGGDLGVLAALFSKDRVMGLRQSMAKQLVTLNMLGLDDATGDNTLIKGRNRKALQVLDKELAAGKTKLAIFYGAGHMEDMAERLEADFELNAEATRWLKAWDLQRP